ncbi:MAG: hypothetical protein WCX69_01795 [Candidatus Paceibacterota bacterium]
MKIRLLLVALSGAKASIDIVTTNNRTYQVSGHPQMQGMWRRHPHKGGHMSRSKCGEAEMQQVLGKIKTIKLWVGPLEFRVVTEAELAKELEPYPIGVAL